MYVIAITMVKLYRIFLAFLLLLTLIIGEVRSNHIPTKLEQTPSVPAVVRQSHANGCSAAGREASVTEPVMSFKQRLSTVGNWVKADFSTLAQWSSQALFSTPRLFKEMTIAVVQTVAEVPHHIADYTTRTLHYLRAVRCHENEKKAQGDRSTMDCTPPRTIGEDRQRAESATHQPPTSSPAIVQSPARRTQETAARAGLRPENVPYLALWLEEPVRAYERTPSVSSGWTKITSLFSWRKLALQFYPAIVIVFEYYTLRAQGFGECVKAAAFLTVIWFALFYYTWIEELLGVFLD